MGPRVLGLRQRSRPDGTLIELEGYVSAVEQVYSGEIEIENQNNLEKLDKMMTAIKSGTGSSEPADSQAYYTDVIESMIAQAHASCTSYLVDSYISCTSPSAADVCEAYISDPLRARYLNLDMGEDYERPESENSGFHGKGAEGWCYYYKNPPPAADTDTEGSGSSSSGGTIGDFQAPTQTGGADETSGADSTGEGAEAPFGPIEQLVHCNQAQTSCTYDPALLDNVFAASDQVLADGALLRLLGPNEAGYPGVRLEGFDRGEPSTELAAAVGLQNGDVLQSANGTTLKDEASLDAVLKHLLEKPAATFVYMRDNRTREVRIEPR